MTPDTANEMVVGYNAAADRIEIEVGKPHGIVLDIGCNDGSGMEALEARWPDAFVRGIEPDAEYVDKARAKGFIVFRDRADSTGYVEESVNFVFSRHSLEHVPDPVLAVAELWRILRPGGLAYFQIPIEPAGSPNALHVSAFKSQQCARDLFHKNLWRERYWGPQETVVEIIVEKLAGNTRRVADSAGQQTDRPAANTKKGATARLAYEACGARPEDPVRLRGKEC